MWVDDTVIINYQVSALEFRMGNSAATTFSEEIWDSCFMKLSSKLLQNLPYFLEYENPQKSTYTKALMKENTKVVFQGKQKQKYV